MKIFLKKNNIPQTPGFYLRKVPLYDKPDVIYIKNIESNKEFLVARISGNDFCLYCDEEKNNLWSDIIEFDNEV